MLSCRSLILDVDGVLFDSNGIKEINIRKAASPLLSNDELNVFVNFFKAGNGIPRETKIAFFFGYDTKAYREVLNAYNAFNQTTLFLAPLTRGAKKFLVEQYKVCNIWAISGGAEMELKELFKRNGLTKYFKGIHGGPMSKKEHLASIRLAPPICYIGDSKMDYESAKQVGAKFFFMYSYTQFKEWKSYFRNFPEVNIIKDLMHVQPNQ